MNPLERLRALKEPIAFSHYSVADDISGVTTWLRSLLLQLHADGVPLVVLLHHFGKQVERSSLFPVLRDAGIPVEIVPRSAMMEADVRGTLDFLQRHRPALFLPQCLNAFYFAASIAGKQGLPWVLTMHSDDPDYWAIAEAGPPEHHGGRMVCVSRHLSAEVSGRGLARSPVVIPYGVPAPAARAAYRNAPFTVAFSGRMVEEQKRFSLVVRTLIKACEREPGIAALLMGDGTSRGPAEREVEAAGLVDRIRFTGALTPERVRQELADCQALLLMSDYEGLPVSLLEAMSMGVVPVVRDIPSGIPELIRHGATGLLVDGDADRAAEALVALSRDRSTWERCSMGTHALVTDGYLAEASYTKWTELLSAMAVDNARSPRIRIPRRIAIPPVGTRLAKGYDAAPGTGLWTMRVLRALWGRSKRVIGSLRDA